MSGSPAPSRLSDFLNPFASGMLADTKLLEFQRQCAGYLGVFSLLMIACLGPINWVGSTLYACGRVMSRLTLAYMVAEGGWEWGLVACAVLYSIVASFVIFKLAQASIVCFSRAIRPEEALKTDGSPGNGVMSKVFGCCVWAIGMIVLDIPVLLSVIAASLPTNNTLNVTPTQVLVIELFTPVVLVLICSLVLPTMCKLVVQPWVTQKDSTSVLGLLIVSRLLITVVQPILSHVAINDSCFGMWRRFWDVCTEGSNYFDLHDPTTGTMILSTEEMCQGEYRPNRCSRSVIEFTASLLARKLAIEMIVRPLFSILISSVSWIRSRFRQSTTLSNLLSIGPLSSVQSVTWVQICLIYSFLSPLVGVLAWLTIVVNFVVGRLLSWRGGLVEKDHAPIPLWCLWSTVFVQWAITFWYFCDTMTEWSVVMVEGVVSGLVGIGAIWVCYHRLNVLTQ